MRSRTAYLFLTSASASFGPCTDPQPDVEIEESGPAPDRVLRDAVPLEQLVNDAGVCPTPTRRLSFITDQARLIHPDFAYWHLSCNLKAAKGTGLL